MDKTMKTIQDLAYVASFLNECTKYTIEYIESGKINNEDDKEALIETLKTGLKYYEKLQNRLGV